jgi:hypothetical protein
MERRLALTTRTLLFSALILSVGPIVEIPQTHDGHIHLRHILLHAFNSGLSAERALLVIHGVYGENAISRRSCFK